MFFNRNKFNKLKREDVVNAICDLEKEEQAIEARIQSDAKVIADQRKSTTCKKKEKMKSTVQCICFTT